MVFELYLIIINYTDHHIMNQFLAIGIHFRFIFPLLFLIFFALDGARAQSRVPGLPFVRNFQADQYKAGLQNFNIAQDRRGIIYIANNYGLVEYDGDQWRTYGVKSGTKVRSLAIDGKGRIYVGSQGDFGYFFPDESGQLTYTSLADSLETRDRNFDETWSVYIDQEKVYFCTFTNLYVYNGKSISVIKPPTSLDLSFMVNRQLYVNQRGAGLSVLDGSSLKPIEDNGFFNDLSVSSILPLQDDHLVLSTTQHGIFQLLNGKVMPWNERWQKFFMEANINCMIRLKNGNFAAGTQNEGLLILDMNGNILMQLTRDRGLLNRTVLGLYEDDLNHLWVGQNNVIGYITLGSPFSFVKEQSGLPGIGYAAYLDADHLYLGTNTGLYYKEMKENESFKLVDNSGGQVYNVGRFRNDFLISHQKGALLLDKNKATQLSREPGSWLFLALKNHQDKLLEGTYTGLQLYTHKNDHWQLEKKLQGFNESSRVMAEDSDGKIWVTHGYKGAFRITLAESGDSIINVSFYGEDKGFPSNRLINVFKVRNELVFTSERGVFKYNPATDRFVPAGILSNLLGQDVQLWFIQEDAIGNIYFIGREHLGVMRKNAIGDYTLYENEFNIIRKYLNDDLENITILRNNEVLFAAKDGFIHFDPTVPLDGKTTFKTLIRNVTSKNEGEYIMLFGGNYSKGDSIITTQEEHVKPRLPFKNNSINFTFSASSYVGDGDLTYQYYLENFEKEWSEWSSSAQKEYTNLKENKYTFHVRSKNVNGEISEETTYEFRIDPPWYRSPWAITLYLLSGVSVLFIGFSLLERKYQREQEKMVVLQGIELNEKDAKLAKFEIHSREQISKLKNEKLEGELNHMKNELATSTMHLLNKNEFITGIKSELNQIVKKSNQDDLKKELIKISRNIETNISDDSNWEQFEFHFDRVHGDFTTRLKTRFTTLSPQETKLCAYLRMNLSTKEIAQLLNISVRGVEISRYRLRKKLLLGRDQNLQEFILNF
jgi:ligand-binding sensor domain-containing protein